MEKIPFQTIDWKQIAATLHPGETGEAQWQTLQLPGLRLRVVTYSPGYLADHWCEKGHVVHVLAGEFETELADGARHVLAEGMSYVVADGMSAHRSYSADGVRLLIVDGDFLK